MQVDCDDEKMVILIFKKRAVVITSGYYFILKMNLMLEKGFRYDNVISE